MFGFIIQPFRSTKTSWWQINRLKHFLSCSVLWISLFSLAIWHPTGRVVWLLSETNFFFNWCIAKSLRNGMFVQCIVIHSLVDRAFFHVRFVLRWCERLIVIFWSNAWLISWISLVSSLQFGVNQVSLRSIFSGAPFCEMFWTRSV